MNFEKCCREVSGGVEITIKVVPGASRDRIVGMLGDALKIQVAAPPEKGKANEAVIRLLANSLDCPQSQISLVQGQSSARKVLLIRRMTREAVIAKLSGYLAQID